MTTEPTKSEPTKAQPARRLPVRRRQSDRPVRRPPVPDEPLETGGGSVALRAIPWVLFVLALAAAGFLYLQWRSATVAEDRRAEVRSTATDFLDALTNFRAGTIDRDAAELRDLAVGQFAEEVDEFFGEEAAAAIRRSRAVSTGETEAVFVQEVSGESAVVFGVVRQTVDNDQLSQPRIEIVRTEIRMIETADGWKVNQVDILQTPVAPGASAP